MAASNMRRVFTKPATLIILGLVTAATLFQTAVCIPVPIPVPGFTWVVGDASDLDDCHIGAWGQLDLPELTRRTGRRETYDQP